MEYSTVFVLWPVAADVEKHPDSRGRPIYASCEGKASMQLRYSPKSMIIFEALPDYVCQELEAEYLLQPPKPEPVAVASPMPSTPTHGRISQFPCSWYGKQG